MLFLLLGLGLATCHGPGAGNTTGQSSLPQAVDSTDEYGYQHRFFIDTAGLLTGAYERHSAEGILIEEAFYRQGQLDSLRVLFYEKGDTQVVEHYRLGQFEGEYRYYYENGQLQLVGNYVDGAMEGKWRKYYDDGTLMETVTFRDNEENGPFVEYYPNGNLKAEGAYLQGDFEQGELKLYDEEGRLIRKMQCEKGICRTTWVAAE